MELTIELIAEIIHGATSVLYRMDGSKPVSWEQLSEESKNLSYQNVKKLLDEGLVNAEDAHNLWMKTKMDAGWVHGNKFSLKNKTHPSIVPFENLPLTEKVKDEIWVSLITAFSRYK